MTDKSVCAVVVTYNRKKLLINCLEAILKQTRKVDAILIIDNASTDDTAETLFQKGYILSPQCKSSEPFVSDLKVNINSFKLNPISDLHSYALRVIYKIMPENVGGAGGFYEGQKLAYDYGFDFVWMMDDDGFPSGSCLEVLLKKCIDGNLMAINPLVISTDDSSRLSFGLPGHIKTVSDAHSVADSKGLIFNKANPFNGTLLTRDVLRICGFVKKEMFIWGDETEYFFRLRLNRISFATAVESVFNHPTNKAVISSAFFGIYKIAIKPSRLEMNFYRNQAYLARTYNSLSGYSTLFKYLAYYSLNLNLSKSALLLKYYFDGYFDRYKLKNILE